MDFPPIGAEFAQLLAGRDGDHNLLANASFTVPVVMDFRGFNSFYLEVTSRIGNVAPTQYAGTLVLMQWFMPGGAMIYEDVQEFWADCNAPTNGVAYSGSPFMWQGLAHGPQLQLTFINTSAVHGEVFSYEINGSTRQIGEPFARSQSGTPRYIGVDGTLLSNWNVAIGAGATVLAPCQYGYGRAKVRFSSSGPSLTFGLQYGALGTVEQYPAVTTLVRDELVIPKRPVLVSVVNAGVAGTYSASLFRQFESM